MINKIMNYKYTQLWEHHKTDHYITIENDKIIYSYSITQFYERSDDDLKLEAVYVQEEYRNQGYFNKIMNDVLELDFNRLFIIVYNTSFIVDKYIKLGFEYYNDVEDDDRYSWYIYIKK